MLLGLVVVVFVGLAVGSFLTTFVDRLLFRQNWISDRSRCPHCRKTINSYDLIPIVSWLILRAKCRRCQESISWEYPAIEASTCLSLTLVYVLWPIPLENTGDWLELSFWLATVCGLISLAIADFRYFLLPDKIARWVGAFIAAGVGVMAGFEPQILLSSLISCLSCGGLLLFIHYLSKGKMALGDVKLSFSLGLLIGDWKLALVGVGLSSFVGLALGVGIGLIRGQSLNLKTVIPFGPALIAGTVIAFLSQDKIHSFLMF